MEYVETKRGTLNFVNGKSSFKIKSGKEIIGNNIGRLVNDLEITFINPKKEEKSPGTFDTISKYLNILIIPILIITIAFLNNKRKKTNNTN